MTICEAIRFAARAFEDVGVPDPEQDASLLIAFVTGLPRLEARLSGAQPLSPEQEQRFSSLLLSRTQREPLQYLIAEQGFYGLDFYVDNRVLIPRQETETLCELGIAHLQAIPAPTCLDLCTGSGAIAVVIKHECPAALVTACDLSADALEVARQNAASNGADIRFLQGDLFAPLTGERFDLIASNPPYIPSAECDALQPEVMREPRMALDGGDDGFAFYRRIAAEAHAFLTPRGLLLMEVGDNQAQSVQALLCATGHYHSICIHCDLYGHGRVVSAHAAANPT